MHIFRNCAISEICIVLLTLTSSLATSFDIPVQRTFTHCRFLMDTIGQVNVMWDSGQTFLANCVHYPPIIYIYIVYTCTNNSDVLRIVIPASTCTSHRHSTRSCGTLPVSILMITMYLKYNR